MEVLKENLALLAPLVLIQLGLMVGALVDLTRRTRVSGGSKLVWGAAIVVFSLIGPLAYFVFGRKEE